MTIWICRWRMNTLVTSQYQPRLSSITKISSRRISQSDWYIQIKLNHLLITGLLEQPPLYKTLTAVSNYVYAVYLLIAKSGKHVCLIVQNLIWNWRLDLAIATELLILAFWNWKRDNWSAITFICVSQQYA